MKYLAFILTKTKLLRLLAFVLAGWLVGSGVIGEADRSQVGEAVLIVLTGALSLAIERKKDNDAAAAQREIGEKPDGWIGPKTRASIRRQSDLPVSKAPRPGARGRLDKGYAQLPILLAVLLWVLIALAIFGVLQIGTARGSEPFPDITETPRIGEADVIVWSPTIDRRPFLVRLLASLRPWAETSASRARLRVTTTEAEFTAHWRENDTFTPSKVLPRDYAIGLSGGTDF
jgi:hypothetical protein